MRYVSSKIGFGLSIYLVMANVAQVIMVMLAGFAAAALGMGESEVRMLGTNRTFIWIVTDVSMYLIAFPVFCRYVKNMEVCPVHGKVTMPLPKFLLFMAAALGAGYWFNLIGTGINYGIAHVTGKSAEEMDVISGVLSQTNPLIILLLVAILAPIVEEWMFRGVVLERVRMYGDKTAVIYTAILFGLFHGNLIQFLYAAVLGLFFGYLKVKTNDLRYPIAAHIIVNLSGSLVIPGLTGSKNQMLSILGIALMAAVMLFSILYIGKHYTEGKLQNDGIAKEEEPPLRKIYASKGMLVFYLFTGVVFAVSILMA